MQKKIVILGAGESGTGAALLAKAHDYDVFVSDSGEIKENFREELAEAGISFEEKGHSFPQILNSSQIIKSPGIPEDSAIMKKIRSHQIRVVSEIEFAASHSNTRFVAVTGTNGKTTTTLLTYHLLKNCGFNTGLAGNVGQSLARQILNDSKNARELYVVELSSFQLDDLFDFKAYAGILLNITPDHLDRYGNDFAKYSESKFRILRNMTEEDAFIYWGDDPVIRDWIHNNPVIPKKIRISLEDPSADCFAEGGSLNILDNNYSLDSIPLKGRHNHINIMAAISAAIFAGAEHNRIEAALKTYQNAPHRMEYAGNIDGVTFINDSKATNVESVFYALDAYDQGIVWIAGGVDKGNDYTRLIPLVDKKVKALICLGVDNSKLKNTFSENVKTICETNDIKEAARLGYEYAQKNDVVLLSPACASFDLFKNYEDRGEQFKMAVNELKKELQDNTI